VRGTQGKTTVKFLLVWQNRGIKFYKIVENITPREPQFAVIIDALS